MACSVKIIDISFKIELKLKILKVQNVKIQGSPSWNQTRIFVVGGERANCF